ncbi:MAG: ABC transporter ATP-binding protein [Phycisphaerae bacterium]
MADVTLAGVTKRYRIRGGDVVALDGVDLAIPEGELLVLVGPSGCGKTTTLRLIAGLESVTGGTIRIGGAVANRMDPKDRNVAMVFQDHALYPHMTVRGNMAFGLRVRGAPDDQVRERVWQTAESLGIEALLDRKPATLSGGQRQRVALGRAIVRRPAVFLFDEPLSDLDAARRRHMRRELKCLQQRLGTTTVYVTHDCEEAMGLGDRIAVMVDGRLLQCGGPQEVYDRPASRLVANGLGGGVMNYLEGRLKAINGKPCFVGPIGRLPLAKPGASLVGHVGRQVTLGIRPEHLRVEVDSPSSAGSAAGGRPDDWIAVGRMTVELVAPLGDRTELHLRGDDGQCLTVRCGEKPPPPGQRVNVWLDETRAHFFEPGKPGKRLGETGS